MVNGENMKVDNKGWVYCEVCGKKLLRRKPNGVFVFKFGKNSNQESVVNLEIFGSIRMVCFRDDCRHVNDIPLFPPGTIE